MNQRDRDTSHDPSTITAPFAWDAFSAVADTLIPHPVYAADFVWNDGVHATLQRFAAAIPTAEDGAAR